MNLFPKRKNGDPHPFSMKIVVALGLIVVVLATIVVIQLNAPKRATSSTGLSQGELFGTALKQMETSKARGTPMDSANPLVLTAKAVGGSPDAQTTVSNTDAQLTLTAMLAIATRQASTPAS